MNQKVIGFVTRLNHVLIDFLQKSRKITGFWDCAVLAAPNIKIKPLSKLVYHIYQNKPVAVVFFVMAGADKININAF